MRGESLEVLGHGVVLGRGDDLAGGSLGLGRGVGDGVGVWDGPHHGEVVLGVADEGDLVEVAGSRG